MCVRVAGLQVLAGAVVAQGELDAVVVATAADTFFGKTMSLLGTTNERGHLQKVRGGAFWRGSPTPAIPMFHGQC